jgi:hypothetical protein
MHIGLGFCTHQALPKSKALAQLAQKYEIVCCKLTASMLFRAKMLHKGYFKVARGVCTFANTSSQKYKAFNECDFLSYFKNHRNENSTHAKTETYL